MYWNKLVDMPDKLSGKLYRLLSKLFISGNRDIPWMNYIKLVFDETGFSNIWGDQKYINPEFFKVTIKQRFERSIHLKMLFLILTILQEGNIIQNSKLSSNWRIVFCDCMLFIETIFVNQELVI